MGQDEIRATLLELFPENEADVDDFLSHVDNINEVAETRIARAKKSTDETPGEAVEDEVADEEEEVNEEETTEEQVEETEEEETEEEEEQAQEETDEVENEEETNEDDVIEVELGESFVEDLVQSEAFRSLVQPIIDGAVNQAVATVRAEYDERFRALGETVEEVQEWNQDQPARTKRAVVSYRPKTNLVQRDGVEAVETSENASYAEVAADSVSEIFDN